MHLDSYSCRRLSSLPVRARLARTISTSLRRERLQRRRCIAITSYRMFIRWVIGSTRKLLCCRLAIGRNAEKEKPLRPIGLLRIISACAMVDIVQLARTPDCGSGGRRFESDYPPQRALKKNLQFTMRLYRITVTQIAKPCGPLA